MVASLPIKSFAEISLKSYESREIGIPFKKSATLEILRSVLSFISVRINLLAKLVTFSVPDTRSSEPRKTPLVSLALVPQSELISLVRELRSLALVSKPSAKIVEQSKEI